MLLAYSFENTLHAILFFLPMLLCNVIQLLITVGDLDHDLDLSLGSSASKRSDPDSTENERSSKTDPWLGDWRMPSIKDGVCVPTTCHCS